MGTSSRTCHPLYTVHHKLTVPRSWNIAYIAANLYTCCWFTLRTAGAEHLFVYDAICDRIYLERLQPRVTASTLLQIIAVAFSGLRRRLFASFKLPADQTATHSVLQLPPGTFITTATTSFQFVGASQLFKMLLLEIVYHRPDCRPTVITTSYGGAGCRSCSRYPLQVMTPVVFVWSWRTWQ